MPEYTDVHRAFLQAALTNGTMSKHQAIYLLTNMYAHCGIPGRVSNAQDVVDVVDLINTQIAPFDQKIFCVHYEPTGMDYVVFVNLDDTPTMHAGDA